MHLSSPVFTHGLINLDHPGHYLQFGIFQLSWANAIYLTIMVLLFLAALVLPFPGSKR